MKINEFIKKLKKAKKRDEFLLKTLNENLYDKYAAPLYSEYTEALVELMAPGFYKIVGNAKFEDGKFVSDLLNDSIYCSFCKKDIKKCIKFYERSMLFL